MMLRALILFGCLQQDPLPPKQDDIDAALKRASDWLLGRVKEGSPLSDNCPIIGGRQISDRALVLYALHHAGADPEDPGFKRLVTSVVEAKVVKTYQAACTAMALNAIDSKKHRAKIYECGQFLADNMCDNGQWSYGTEYDIPKIKLEDESGTRSKVIIKRQKPVGGKNGDNSNTQYAALGLRACGLAGFEFEGSFLDKAIAWWENSQKGDGSWDYAEKGASKEKDAGYGSMTAGGGASVAILRRLKNQSQKPASTNKAIGWLGSNWTVTENPASPDNCKRFHYYYLYAIERLGDVTPVDRMGKHLWYVEGAKWLLAQQQGGMWSMTGTGMEVADTCFAILFLKRATRVATGDHK